MDAIQETLTLSGLSCGHCVAAVRTALEEAGATVEEVTLTSARVSYDPEQTERRALEEAVEEAGYEVVSGQ